MEKIILSVFYFVNTKSIKIGKNRKTLVFVAMMPVRFVRDFKKEIFLIDGGIGEIFFRNQWEPIPTHEKVGAITDAALIAVAHEPALLCFQAMREAHMKTGLFRIDGVEKSYFVVFTGVVCMEKEKQLYCNLLLSHLR